VGHLNKVNIYIDENLDRFKDLYAAAGHPKCVFKISCINLVQITNGLILDITE
jgi:prolyl-tRNA editing enzyme YbaK/EbsC (Cys-tRNA(Pro) deacylase)